jgi:hypothetical protein
MNVAEHCLYDDPGRLKMRLALAGNNMGQMSESNCVLKNKTMSEARANKVGVELITDEEWSRLSTAEARLLGALVLLTMTARGGV